MKNKREKIEACIKFYEELSEKLFGKYTTLASCNNDISSYLCIKGTESEVTYYSKPELSFRISDHWNWYANLKRCDKDYYIQCYSPYLPYPKQREEPGKAGKPVHAISVMIFKNNKYYPVYGEIWKRNGKHWSWVENSVDDVISKYNLLAEV